MENKISIQALRRLPYYLKYLENYDENDFISASKIASSLELSEIQVRKDLALISKAEGIPNKGFKVYDLMEGLKDFLGYNNPKDAILIGAGNLGKALLAYNGFNEYGLNIVVAFDKDKSLIGREINGKKVFSIDKLQDIAKRLNVHLAILTVPDDAAQGFLLRGRRLCRHHEGSPLGEKPAVAGCAGKERHPPLRFHRPGCLYPRNSVGYPGGF